MREFESDPIDSRSAGGGAAGGTPIESVGGAPKPAEAVGNAPGDTPDPGGPRPPGRPDEGVGDAPSPDESVGRAPSRTGVPSMALIVGGVIALIAIIAAIFGFVAN
jgi:hypothetical protein